MPIHVCYAVHDRNGSFCKLTGTSMCSILVGTREEVVFHLLHDATLTEENRAKFLVLMAMHPHGSIRFYPMEELEPEALAAIREKASLGRFSQATFYRLLMMRVLPREVERVIYLDSDIIVNLDIGELWREETGENGLAAVSEQELSGGLMLPKAVCDQGKVAKERYFNAGVLLIDMKKYREMGELWREGLQLLEEHPEYTTLDQDILNYFFAAEYRLLPVHYDEFVVAVRRRREPPRHAIYHYAGLAIDLTMEDDPYNRLFLEHYFRTPWLTPETLLRLGSAAGRIAEEERRRAAGFMAQMARRKCVVVCPAENQKEIETYFGGLPEVIYLLMKRVGKEQNFDIAPVLKFMAEHRERIYIFCVPNFEGVRNFLLPRGCQEGKDFVHGGFILPVRLHGMAPQPEKLLEQL